MMMFSINNIILLISHLTVQWLTSQLGWCIFFFHNTLVIVHFLYYKPKHNTVFFGLEGIDTSKIFMLGP